MITQNVSFFVNDVVRRYKLRGLMGKLIRASIPNIYKNIVKDGTITDDRTQTFRIYKQFDTITFIRYLGKLHRRYGRIIVPVDGAAQHRSGDHGHLVRHHATVALRRFSVGVRRHGAEQTQTPKCANTTTHLRT